MTTKILRDLSGDFPRGTWRGCLRDGQPAANFHCPKCDFVGGLGFGTNHEIGYGGAVSPSVVCDNGDFHEFVELEGWNKFLTEHGR